MVSPDAMPEQSISIRIGVSLRCCMMFAGSISISWYMELIVMRLLVRLVSMPSVLMDGIPIRRSMPAGVCVMCAFILMV